MHLGNVAFSFEPNGTVRIIPSSKWQNRRNTVSSESFTIIAAMALVSTTTMEAL
jgi:hypothetical protein